MAVKRNPWAIGISTTVNLGILAFAIWLGIKTVVNIVKPPVTATNIDVGNFDLKAPKAGVAAVAAAAVVRTTLSTPSRASCRVA